eukprot:756348-Hanusia_phi.AAC.7
MIRRMIRLTPGNRSHQCESCRRPAAAAGGGAIGPSDRVIGPPGPSDHSAAVRRTACLRLGSERPGLDESSRRPCGVTVSEARIMSPVRIT